MIFEALPSRADDLKAGNRDRAARAAALAGCGRGEDDPKPDDAERAELRKLALGWLSADLAARRKLLEAGDSQERAGVAQALRRWKQDADLAGIRDVVPGRAPRGRAEGVAGPLCGRRPASPGRGRPALSPN